MFSFLKNKKSEIKKQLVVFKLSGLHCTSCSLNIDGALEDTPGVVSATTSYAHSTTHVEFEAKLVTKEKLSAVIIGLGYSIVAIE